jgi:hypothetical protein
VKRAGMAHEPRDAGALALQALRLARVAVVVAGAVAVVCLGGDAREVFSAVAALP